MTKPRNVIKAAQVGGVLVGSHEHEATAASRTPAAAVEKPVVTLHRSGDLIEAIEITCACGKTMVFECVYAEEKQS